MGQKFYADPKTRFTFPNGAVGYSPSVTGDTLGPFAKVENCPIAGTHLRRTCYATAHHDSYFSVPACTRIDGRHIAGFFSTASGGAGEGGILFTVMDRHKDRIRRHLETFAAQQAVEKGLL